MLTAFPLLLIPVVIYNIYAFSILTGASVVDADLSLREALFSINMPSGGVWGIGVGDLLVFFSLVLLFFELLKSTSSRKVAIINHALSMGLLVICIGEFLIMRSFATSTFFLILVMLLLDVMAGFIVTIITARRDLERKASAKRHEDQRHHQGVDGAGGEGENGGHECFRSGWTGATQQGAGQRPRPFQISVFLTRPGFGRRSATPEYSELR